jgi:hypothetical protein
MEGSNLLLACLFLGPLRLQRFVVHRLVVTTARSEEFVLKGTVV